MCPQMLQENAGTVFVMPKRSSGQPKPKCVELRPVSASGGAVLPISNTRERLKSSPLSGSLTSQEPTRKQPSDERLYVATQEGYTVEVYDVLSDKPKAPLNPRNDLHDYAQHFGWGCDHESVLQLTLALLADALGSDRRALLVHDWFAANVLSKIDPNSGWFVSQTQVRDMVRGYEEIIGHYWSDEARAYMEEAIP